MRILFPITRADTIAGAQVHVRDIAIALQQQHHKVLVVTGKQGIYNSVLEEAGIDCLACDVLEQKISPIRDGASLRFLLATIRKFQPNLISAHSSKTGILGRLAAKIAKIPCLFTAHGWSFTAGVPEPSRTIYQWMERIAEPLADQIICVSECDRTLGIQSGMNPQRLVTIHNGMPDISESLRANPGQSDRVKIVMVARFDRQKDHSSLIEALKDIPAAELILVGDGPSLAAIQTQVNRLGIAERVQFKGFCSNVAEILAQAQIFALISHWEGLPRTIVEAMRAGLPVIASDVGGVSEIVVDGATGYLIPRNDVPTLHQRLSELVNNTKLRQEMGYQGRQRYEANFTFEQMYQKTVQLYEQLISNY